MEKFSYSQLYYYYFPKTRDVFEANEVRRSGNISYIHKFISAWNRVKKQWLNRQRTEKKKYIYVKKKKEKYYRTVIRWVLKIRNFYFWKEKKEKGEKKFVREKFSAYLKIK